MLAAIIANLQNVQSQRLPKVHVDRGGGGPSWSRYEIVDIITAINSFREIPGEHPVARAARRHRHIGEVLPGIREAREAREGVVFLAGAQVGAAAVAAAVEAEAPRPIAAAVEADVQPPPGRSGHDRASSRLIRDERRRWDRRGRGRGRRDRCGDRPGDRPETAMTASSRDRFSPGGLSVSES